MARKPRIITLTVKRLHELADRVETFRAGESVSELTTELRDIADRLNDYDARETRKDPSKRKAKKAKVRR